jgi:UDP-N-acetylmuramate dehydrogenase
MNMTEPARFRPAAILRGIDRRDAPTAKLVSWRAGGPAARVYQPADLADLVAFLRGLPPEEPVMFAGLGSNLLVRDGGLRGTLVLTHGALSGFAPDPRGDAPAGSLQWVAGAGVPCPKVARQTALHGCEGAEFLAGIPGTLGGALAMNAGCYGGQTWERVVRVTLITRDGQLVERLPGEFEVGYRHVALRGRTRLGMDEWFVEATLRLPRGDGERARARIREFLARRIATQPLQQPNAGSVFRNPPGGHAARLIESCGLKGLQIGGARVSERHANFIVNAGGASAADIEAVIEQVHARVLGRTGVDLVREVRIVGERAHG